MYWDFICKDVFLYLNTECYIVFIDLVTSSALYGNSLTSSALAWTLVAVAPHCTIRIDRLSRGICICNSAAASGKQISKG